jgi:hypothetical protein
MWVRIARFEGADVESWDERIEEIRNRIRSGGGEAGSADRPPIKRAMMLADRQGGRGAGVMFSDSEEDIRRVDEFMSKMTPPAGAGSRTSVEIYEVVVDEEPG